MNKLTLDIYPEDCVGDSSAKHNYNALILDTTICNLSSQFFLVNNNFNSVFNDFQNNLPNFINFAKNFYNPNIYNIATAATQLLSSYWNQHEFSVHYPLNISDLNNLSCPTINQKENVLESLAFVFLTKNYPAIDFTKNTIANVVFFLYSVPVDPSDPSKLQTTQTSPEFSYTVRNMNVSIIRQDIHFGQGKIYRFQNTGKGEWKYFATTVGTSLSSVNNFVIPAPFPNPRILIPAPGQQTNRSKINITVDASTFNYDVYAAALGTGLYTQGYSDIYITIANNVTIGSTSSLVPALIVPSFSVTTTPAFGSSNPIQVGFYVGDTVTIINNGNIIGAGGNGGYGQSWGEILTPANDGKAGGDALFLHFPTNFTNTGLIAGGGGGGAGGYIGGINQNIFNPTMSIDNLFAGNGGGGGAGAVAGLGGAGGKGYDNINQIISNPTASTIRTNNISIVKSGILNGNVGNAANTNTAGKGGINSKYPSSNGGSGGALGVAGTSTGPLALFAGIPTQYSPKGGAAGNYINGKSYLFLTTKNGSTLGNAI